MSSNRYFSHRIYCGISYKEIINLLSGYLVHNRYLVDSSDGYRLFKYSDMRLSHNSAAVIAGPAKFVFNDYNGIVFRVENYRQKIASGQIKWLNFPISVRQRFSIPPNAITIETYIALYQMQKQIGGDLLGWLTSKNRNVYIREFEDEYIDIIESAYDDPAEKADEIHKLINSYVDKNKRFYSPNKGTLG